ncbi:uncharacterized protein LOC143198428 isoform X2 [Rhynchophorus ferrugineus]|uniref:Uncharacterized protein n=1 Tax=Rhynchophorus ferrugineus TaxID=354439 RepID=A0A834I713_RHYFE|nr:hypothetical protein GWI33_011354 [Rhynchophorus ferrugineus]
MADGTDAVEKPADDPDVNRSPRDDFPGNDITSTEIDTECHRSYPCASPEDAMDQLLAGEQDLDECYPYETLSADDEDIVDVKLDERDGDHVPKDDGNDTRNKRDDEEEEEAPKDDSDTMNKPISAAKLAKTLKKRSIKCICIAFTLL